MGKRKNISKKIRFEVFKRDKFTCQYCGKTAPDVVLEVDHIIPVVDGGTNDMLNLITSCFDCNRGKGKRSLNDDTTIKKQQHDLKILADKNEQLEMLIEWRKGLLNLKDKEIDKIAEYFEEINDCQVNDNGKTNIKKWLKDFSVEEILSAIDIASDRYMDSDSNVIFNYVPRIAYVKKHTKDDSQLYYYNYIKKCMKKDCYYINYNVLHSLIYENIFNDDDFETVKQIYKKTRNWTMFCNYMREYFECEV